MSNNYSFFASTYGSSTYDGSTYDGSSSTTSTASGTSGLSNTGFDLLLIVTLACALIFVALLVRFFRKPKKQLSN